MKLISLSTVFGAIALTGCNLLPSNGVDSYFATSVGKEAGHAEALAAACPSLSFNEAELDLHRIAICRAEGLADDCALPGLDAERQASFEQTIARLNDVAPAQVCADARAEAAVDPVLAEYWQ